jgi:hypothetical protein
VNDLETTSAPASDPAGVGGTVAPLSTPAQEAPKQTAAQKRAATLQRKKDAAAKRAAAREARQAKPPAEQPAKEAEAEPIADELDDKTLRENLAAGLNVLWLVAQLVAGLFGRKLRDYEDAEREADAKAWLPIARRWPSLGKVAGWVGAPVRFVQRFREKLEPKKADA